MSGPTKIGVVFSQADSGVDARAIRAWAVDAEAAGFDHIMAYDHVLGASAARLGPGPFGSFPNAPYTNDHVFHEILTLFSHLAAATTTIDFVSSVLVLPQRQAAVAAKQIATVDLLSDHRLRIAVGVGWNWAEYEALGADFAQRSALLAEQITVMRQLWTEPLVEFDGTFHHLHGVGMNPLPTQPIPVYIGSGASPAALRRVIQTGDGWMPLLIAGLDEVDVGDAIVRLRQMSEDLGRDPATLPIHGRVYLIDGWQRELERLVALGVEHCSVGFHRIAFPGHTHAEHLQAVIDAKAEVDAIVG